MDRTVDMGGGVFLLCMIVRAPTILSVCCSLWRHSSSGSLPDTMVDTLLQPRTRHLIAVFALLISSVGGFVPQTYRRIHHPNNAVAPAVASSLLRSHRAPLHCGRCRQRGEWGGNEEQRWPGALCGQGLATGETTGQQRTGNNNSLVGSGSSSARWRRDPRGGTSAMMMMALHFPKPPKMPKPPPPPPHPSGDKTPAGGKFAGREVSTSAASAGSTGGGSGSKGDASSSSVAGAGAMTEGVVDVSGLATKTRNVSAVGHANATRTGLNGGKVSKESTKQPASRRVEG